VLRSICRNILSSQQHCWDHVTAPIALAYFYPGSWPTFSPAFTSPPWTSRKRLSVAQRNVRRQLASPNPSTGSSTI